MQRDQHMSANEESKDGSTQEVGLQEGMEHGRNLVTITINGVSVEIHRGRRSVAELKQVGGVPDTDVIAQQVDGKLVELADDGHVVIKGNEQFVSYPRACASS
jgi:hypothetical protein